MSNEENVQVVNNFFAAIESGDKQALLALVDEGIEWIIRGEDWPLTGTHRGHAGVADVLRKAAEEIEMTYTRPPECIAQGGRVLVVGVATGKIKATTKTSKDDWVFDITVLNSKVTKIRSSSWRLKSSTSLPSISRWHQRRSVQPSSLPFCGHWFSAKQTKLR